MSANVIRKEDKAEVGRWEMEALGAPDHSRVNLPTVDQIDRLHQTAHSEGFEQGYREGRAKASAEAAKLTALLHSVESDLETFDQNIADNVLRFALVVAQAVLRADLEHRPELIIPIIRETVAELPTTGNARRLHLHPLDAALLKEHSVDFTSSGRVDIVEDAAIERGGCKLRSDIGEIDATVSARWKRALASLGRNDDWLTGPGSEQEQGDDSVA